MRSENDQPVAAPQEVAARMRRDLPAVLNELPKTPTLPIHASKPTPTISDDILKRSAALHARLSASLTAYAAEVERAARMLLAWMVEGKIVRIIGAGRSRLAAVIPANRLAHGGAQVYVQDDIIPMPPTIRGGGIIAASASGKTESVLNILRSAHRDFRDVEILGIAGSSAPEFPSLCDVFIGIEPEPNGAPNPLSALADAEEYLISGLLDGLVVSAGKLGGFDEAYWRLGHEDLPPTGPYSFTQDITEMR